MVFLFLERFFLGAMRIVSLLPSATELVYALGAGDYLVGRSHECDFPPEVQAKPACTRPSKQKDLTDPDRFVENLLSIYEIDLELLKALQPDVIITQTLCAQCAVTLEQVQQAVNQVFETQPLILAMEGQTLEGIFEDFEKVSEGLAQRASSSLAQKIKNNAQKLLQQLKKEMDAYSSSDGNPPKVIFIEWLDPLMVAGHWIPQLIEKAGGEPLLTKAGEKSRIFPWNKVVEADPDVVVIAPCGYSLEQTAETVNKIQLHQHPDFRTLRAFMSKQVYLADGNAYFNRPGPRIVKSIGILAEILQPQRFKPTLLGKAWAQYF